VLSNFREAEGIVTNEKKLKKLPLGLSDFKKMVENDYLYVDKTKFIYPLVVDGGYYFLARPRRFGKSLLISTLEALFAGDKKLFKDLWIDQSDYTWKTHPVIKIDFSGADYSSVDRLEKSILKSLYITAKRYDVLVEKTESPKDLFGELIDKLALQNTVVLLIDEYDKPIIDQIHDVKKAEEFRALLQNFYSMIKAKDAALHFVLLTGVSKFARTSIFSGINNLNDLSLDFPYATLLGYTHEELKNYFVAYIEHLAKIWHKESQEVMQQLTSHYDGYQFAENAAPVFNPFSILLCFEKGKLRNYWFESGTPAFLIKLIATGRYTLNQVYQPIMTVEELGAFEPENIRITALLYQSGYLTIKSYNELKREYALDFPNQEVTRSFNALMASSVTQLSYPQATTYAVRIAQTFCKQNFDELQRVLQNLFNEMPYTVHIKREFDLQLIIFSVFKLIGIEVDPEVTTSLGRADLVVSFPKIVYVIELKFNKTAQEALEQIQDKHYYEKFTNTGKQITLIGINFDGLTKVVTLQSQAID